MKTEVYKGILTNCELFPFLSDFVTLELKWSLNAHILDFHHNVSYGTIFARAPLDCDSKSLNKNDLMNCEKLLVHNWRAVNVKAYKRTAYESGQGSK